MSINSKKEPNIRGEVVQLRRIADILEKTTNYRTGEVTQFRRVADALEEILQLVKADQEANKKRMEEHENN
jgi:adenine deaminase